MVLLCGTICEGRGAVFDCFLSPVRSEGIRLRACCFPSHEPACEGRLLYKRGREGSNNGSGF